MRTKIYNLIIIDESGSMNYIKQAAIDNVNETIQTIRLAQKKHEEQEHYVSVVSFNSNVKTVCWCVPIEGVAELTDETYRPNARTALYDAIGDSLNRLRDVVENGDKVLVTVVTDGYDNASVEYDAQIVKAHIEVLKEQGWVFAYIGANQDVKAVGEKLSIDNTMEFETTEIGMWHLSKKMGRASSRFYDTIGKDGYSVTDVNKSFFDDEQDF